MSDDLVTRIHLAIAEFDDARVADCAHEAAKEIKRLRALHATVCAELFRVDAENITLRHANALNTRQCGTCADWLVQNVWTLQNVPTPVGGLCKSATSHCAAALDGSEWPMEWPADHACPSWRAKDA